MTKYKVQVSEISSPAKNAIAIHDDQIAALAKSDPQKLSEVLQKAGFNAVAPKSIGIDKNGNTVITDAQFAKAVAAKASGSKTIDSDNHPCGINIICGSF